jgi:phage shock protein A
VLAQDSGKLDELEARLQQLIQEQESEVIKLRAENSRVRNLQEECQKQLDRLNREAEEQERQ